VARADLFFLKDSLERGMSLAEIAGFLRRTANEVQEKAKDLNRPHAGIDDKTPISRLALTENNVLRLHI
jgi:uncharacterized protein (DUF2384 family)